MLEIDPLDTLNRGNLGITCRLKPKSRGGKKKPPS